MDEQVFSAEESPPPAEIKISKLDWAVLQNQAESLQWIAHSLEPRVDQETLVAIRAEYEEISVIMDVLRSRCKDLKLLLNHDVYQPFVGLRTYFNVLARGVTLSPTAFRQVTTVIRNGIKEALVGIGAVQFFVEGEKLRSKPARLKGLLNEVISYMALTPDSIRINVPETVHVMTHSACFEMLFVNMIKNAVSRGGASRMLVESCAKDGVVELSISDNGCGVSEAAAPHVFELMFTTEQNGKGIGLGRADEKMAVMGGGIEVVYPNAGLVNSEGGFGAKFILKFKEVVQSRPR